MDQELMKFLARLREVHMEPHVNIIIMSDHGMTYGSNPILNQHPVNFRQTMNAIHVKKVHLGRELKEVHRKIKMVVGSGAYSMIYPRRPADTRMIIEKLRTRFRSSNPDIKVFSNEEIPEELHWQVNLRPAINYREPKLICRMIFRTLMLLRS